VSWTTSSRESATKRCIPPAAASASALATAAPPVPKSRLAPCVQQLLFGVYFGANGAASYSILESMRSVSRFSASFLAMFTRDASDVLHAGLLSWECFIERVVGLDTKRWGLHVS
jgi:hypothetical protein